MEPLCRVVAPHLMHKRRPAKPGTPKYVRAEVDRLQEVAAKTKQALRQSMVCEKPLHLVR
jgi:hypothetical protein